MENKSCDISLPKHDRDVTFDMALHEFWGLTNEKPAHFNRHVIRDENRQSGRIKKRRTIFAPDDRARSIHRVIVLVCRLGGRQMPSATGGVPGFSPLRGLMPHRIWSKDGGPWRFARYWYLTDLSGAYSSVPLDRMAKALCNFVPALAKNPLAVEEVLRRHCFLQGSARSKGKGLYTGGPCSPDLFNIYCDYWLDPVIRAMGFAYTRWIDDLTLTSLSRFGRRRRHAVMQAIKDAALVPNLKKTQGRDLKKGSVLVTGLTVHWDGRVGISKQYAARLRGLINAAECALNAIEKGELGLLPRGFCGTYGILKTITRNRSMTQTELELTGRYNRVRERIRALRGVRKKKKKTSKPAAAT